MRSLDDIRATHAAYLASHDHPGSFACCTAHASADNVPGLVTALEVANAENTRLRAQVAAADLLTLIRRAIADPGSVVGPRDRGNPADLDDAGETVSNWSARAVLVVIDDLAGQLANLRTALAVFTDYTAAGIVVAPVAETATAIAELIEAQAEKMRESHSRWPEMGAAHHDGTWLAEGARIAREYAEKEG